MESKVIIAPTLPTFGHSTVYVYPTVSPKVVVVPILTCIFGFPVLVMLIICALRYRARRARTSAKKSHMRRDQSMLELTSGASILASRCSSEKEPRTNFKKKKKTLVRFKPMPEIDLDTVVEEKSEFDAEVTATDLLSTPEEFVVPEEDTPVASFRAYRYMGAVQGGGGPGSKPSPLRSPHLNKQLDNGNEKINCNDDLTNEMDAVRTKQSEEDDRDADSIVSPKTENRVDGSSGSSDSDTIAACFSLSPKQVTKSPTAVHLALKKLDGVMNRRHSSPVKVNYANPRPQRSSGKVNYSYTGEDGTLMPKKKKPAIDDYIDRELMPDFSPRSHSVKTPSRKSQSFCSKRRGESFKHKKQTLSRSMSHALSSSHENVKQPDLIEMGECNIKTPTKTLVHPSLSTPVYNSFTPCEIRVVDEDKEICCVIDNEQNSGLKKDLRIELDPKTVCGAISLTNGSGTDCSTMPIKTPHEDSFPLASPIHPRSWSCSVTLQSEKNDSESPTSRKGGGVGGGLRPARKAWPDNLCLSDGAATCPGLPLRSPERLIGSLGDRGRAANGDKNYANIMNDYTLKYRQDESKYMSHCQTCTINVESDDERSTLV